MAKRVRNHKAEYAARKAKARKLGYTGVSQYRKVRKATGITGRTPTPPRKEAAKLPGIGIHLKPRKRATAAIRKEAAAWSKKHSHSNRSKFNPDWNDRQVKAYHRTYVQRVTGMSRRKAAREKRYRIWQYLTDFDYIDDQEWHEDWKSDATAV